MFKRPLACALNDRAIGERIAEGNTQLNNARTRINGCQDDFTCGGEVGIAAGYVGDERWFIFEMKGHEGSIEISHKRPFGIGCTQFTHSGEISD